MTFSAENFRRIFEIENRKGIDLSGRFFPQLNDLTHQLSAISKEIRETRRKLMAKKSEELRVLLKSLEERRSKLKSARSCAIDQRLKAVSSKVQKRKFTISLTRRTVWNGREIYSADSSPESYFTIKQLQFNVSRLYKVKQSNRHALVSQLYGTLSSGFPFDLVRTDVSTFYDSVNRERLLTRLDTDNLLSASSMRFLRQILESYGQISGKEKGIPQGIGISAYLAEYYLRPADRAIRSIPGLVLYCRYVDDIVAVFARPPSTKGQKTSYVERIKKTLMGQELSLNLSKTKQLTIGSNKPKDFEYLGYRFDPTRNGCALRPSASKTRKYKSRIDASFREYDKQRWANPRRAHRLLVNRIRFLTGNCRLTHSKSNIATGIYFNNPLVTDFSAFESLDEYLTSHVQSLPSMKLKNQLRGVQFSKGFKERRFHNFSTEQLALITAAWKHG